MSVECEVYLGVFVELPKDIDFYDDKYDDYMNGVDKFRLIYDGISGEYIRFGIVLAMIEEIYEFNKEIVDLSEVSIVGNIVENKTIELFGLDLQPELMLFSHCY